MLAALCLPTACCTANQVHQLKLKMCCGYHSGRTADELRELTVEGTSFDPNQGGVEGLTSLDCNLEVNCSLLVQPVRLAADHCQAQPIGG